MERRRRGMSETSWPPEWSIESTVKMMVLVPFVVASATADGE
jgi:hypothetical protein